MFYQALPSTSKQDCIIWISSCFDMLGVKVSSVWLIVERVTFMLWIKDKLLNSSVGHNCHIYKHIPKFQKKSQIKKPYFHCFHNMRTDLKFIILIPVHVYTYVRRRTNWKSISFWCLWLKGHHILVNFIKWINLSSTVKHIISVRTKNQYHNFFLNFIFFSLGVFIHTISGLLGEN